MHLMEAHDYWLFPFNNVKAIAYLEVLFQNVIENIQKFLSWYLTFLTTHILKWMKEDRKLWQGGFKSLTYAKAWGIIVLCWCFKKIKPFSNSLWIVGEIQVQTMIYRIFSLSFRIGLLMIRVSLPCYMCSLQTIRSPE